MPPANADRIAESASWNEALSSVSSGSMIGAAGMVLVVIGWTICSCTGKQPSKKDENGNRYAKKAPTSQNEPPKSAEPQKLEPLPPPPPEQSKIIPAILKEPAPPVNKVEDKPGEELPRYVDIGGGGSQIKKAEGPSRSPVVGTVPSKEAAYRTLCVSDPNFEASTVPKKNAAATLMPDAKTALTSPSMIGQAKSPTASMSPVAPITGTPSMAPGIATGSMMQKEAAKKGAATLAVKGTASLAVKGTDSPAASPMSPKGAGPLPGMKGTDSPVASPMQAKGAGPPSGKKNMPTKAVQSFVFGS